MWHEARKQEKKIRTMVVDYRRRAERRREFYEKFKADPTQFMQVHGRPCKIHMDSQITVAADKCMMPWQEDKDNMIDRFDVRTYLDIIPEHQHSEDPPKEENASILNYERYRILIQNESSKTSEDKFLHQIHIEEQFGTVTGPGRHHHKEKEKPSAPKAAIGYNYEDSNPTGSSWSGGGMKDNRNNPKAEGNANPDPEEEESEEELDFDLLVNMNDLNYAQKAELNITGTQYGLTAGDFMNYLNADLEEKEEIRLAKLQEEEKQTMSGRKARRERRAYKDKIILRKGYISPPSYAASTLMSDLPPGDEEEDEGEGGAHKRSPSGSRDSSPEKIEFITSFGGNEVQDCQPPPPTMMQRRGLNSNRNLPPRPSSSRKWIRSRSRSPERRKMRSRSRSRDRSSRKYVSSSSKSKRDRKRSSSSSDSDSSRDRRRRRRRTHSSNSSHRSRSRTRSRSRERSRRTSSSRRKHRSKSRSISKSRSRNGSRKRKTGSSRSRSRDHRRRERSRERRRRRRTRSRSSSNSSSNSRSPIRRRKSRRSSSSSSPSRKSKSREPVRRPSINSSAKAVSSSVTVTASSLPSENKNGKIVSPVLEHSSSVAISSVIEAPPPRLPSPPVRRYYGRRKESRSDSSDSDSDLSLSDSDKETNSRSSKRSERSSASSGPKGKSSMTASAKGSFAESSSSGVKLTPQERLKKKMAAALNRQLKADKEVEKMRQVKQDEERVQREETLRDLSIKYRRRERERRHRETGDRRNSDSGSSSDMDHDHEPDSPNNDRFRSSHSRSPSPEPAPRRRNYTNYGRRSNSPY